MRLVLVKGHSQYGSLRLHIDQLAAALVSLGHDAVVADLISEDVGPFLSRAFSSPADCLVSFNGMGHDLASRDFIREMNCVFASFYVDHPVHHLARLENKAHKQLLFFLDSSHIQFMAAWGANRAFSHIGLLPPGANELDEPVDVSDDAFAKRDIPLLFTGTYRGPPAPGWLDWPDSPAKQVVTETAEFMAADGQLALLDALRAALEDRRTALSTDLLEAISTLLPAAQRYAEAYHRHAVLTALGAAGVPIEIYGQGWEPLCARFSSFHHAGLGSFEETLHLMRRARMVLNINNGFVEGGHERVFTAMCAGAAVFTDASRYYTKVFDDQELARFALSRLDLAPGQLLTLMADLPAQAAIARAGHRKAMSQHRWGVRATELIKAVQAVR